MDTVTETKAAKDTAKGNAKETAKEAAKSAETKAAKDTAVPPGLTRYRVQLGDQHGEFNARDPDEAWAMFCDAQKKWPSRRFNKPVIEPVE